VNDSRKPGVQVRLLVVQEWHYRLRVGVANRNAGPERCNTDQTSTASCLHPLASAPPFIVLLPNQRHRHRSGSSLFRTELINSQMADRIENSRLAVISKFERLNHLKISFDVYRPFETRACAMLQNHSSVFLQLNNRPVVSERFVKAKRERPYPSSAFTTGAVTADKARSFNASNSLRCRNLSLRSSSPCCVLCCLATPLLIISSLSYLN